MPPNMMKKNYSFSLYQLDMDRIRSIALVFG